MADDFQPPHPPRVSVIMAAYNEEQCIAAAIDSILRQSFTDFELFIVNDGSIDGTQSIVATYVDHRIRVINKANSGLVDSLNCGIMASTGQYIARMDADDYSAPERFRDQVAFLDDHPDLALVGSWARIQDLATGRITEFKPPIDNGAIRRYLQRDNAFVHSSVMMRRSAVNHVGLYRNIHPGEDYELWVRVARDYQVANLPRFLVTRTENDNIKNRPFYRHLKTHDIYRNRLLVQCQAVRFFGLDVRGGFYLAKTCLNLLLATVGIK